MFFRRKPFRLSANRERRFERSQRRPDFDDGVAEPVRQQVAVARGAGSRIRSASRGEQYAGGRHPFRVVSGRLSVTPETRPPGVHFGHPGMAYDLRSCSLLHRTWASAISQARPLAGKLVLRVRWSAERRSVRKKTVSGCRTVPAQGRKSRKKARLCRNSSGRRMLVRLQRPLPVIGLFSLRLFHLSRTRTLNPACAAIPAAMIGGPSARYDKVRNSSIP